MSAVALKNRPLLGVPGWGQQLPPQGATGPLPGFYDIIRAAKRHKLATFEQALAWLRRGKPIRRRAWHPDSCIFRVGPDVFVKLPNQHRRVPDQWRPYPEDILATDWAQVPTPKEGA